MLEAERPFSDQESVVTLESSVIGLSAALGVAPEALEPVDMVLSVGVLFLMLDAPVVEAVEREFLVGPPAVGVTV